MSGIGLSTLIRRLRRDTAPVDGCSDADLLTRFGRARDDAAFELLVWRHGAMVLSTCRRALGNTEDAEDAFQATFLVLARKAAGIRSGVALPAWLHRVAVRVATRVARGRRPIPSLESEPIAPVSPSPAEQSEGLVALDEEINRLSERYRRAVVLCYLEGLTAADAARLLGCPTGTVESRLAAARKLLRDRLTRRGVTLPVGVLAVVGGQGALAPEAVARVVRAAVAFVRDGAGVATGIVGESSMKLAQGVLTMWSVRVRVGLMAAMVAVAASAGVVWAVVADEPEARPAAVVAEKPVAPQPRAKDEPVAPVQNWPFARRFNISGAQWSVQGLTPDSRSLIVTSSNAVGRYDLVTQFTQTVFRSPNTIRAVAYSPDGKMVATSEAANGVKLRDAATGTLIEAFWPSSGIETSQVAFSPDGKRLVTIAQSQPGLHWEAPGPRGFRSDGDPGEVQSKFQISVWDVGTRKAIGWPVEPLPPLTRVDLVADGRFVLKTESIRKPDESKELLGYRFALIDPATGVTGKPVDFLLQSFVPAAGAEPSADAQLRFAPLGGNEPKVSPDGKGILAVKGGEVFIVDLSTGKERLRFARLARPVHIVTYSPDGKWVAAATGFLGSAQNVNAHPTEVVIWNATTGQEVARMVDKETNRIYHTLWFSPDGSYLVGQYGPANSFTYTIWGHPPALAPKAPASTNVAGAPDHFQSLIRELSADSVTDRHRVDLLFAATLGRLPTDIEARTLAAQIAMQSDKAAALRGLLATLVDTPEFQAHSAALQQMAKPTPPPSAPQPKTSPTNPNNTKGGGRPTTPRGGGKE